MYVFENLIGLQVLVFISFIIIKFFDYLKFYFLLLMLLFKLLLIKLFVFELLLVLLFDNNLVSSTVSIKSLLPFKLKFVFLNGAIFCSRANLLINCVSF